MRADGDLGGHDFADLQRVLDARHGKVKVIEVPGDPRAVIVKTTNVEAPRLREDSPPLRVGGKDLKPVLTSGAVGKLKRNASGGTSDGQVSE